MMSFSFLSKSFLKCDKYLISNYQKVVYKIDVQNIQKIQGNPIQNVFVTNLYLYINILRKTLKKSEY